MKQKLRCVSFLVFLLTGIVSGVSAQAPANDHCTDASEISIAGNGYALGSFTSARTNLTFATKQAGESFPKTFSDNGLNRKTAWYKFTIPTGRSVTVELKQKDTLIAQNAVGLVVYKTTGCLPNLSELSTYITSIPKFGNSGNTCLSQGTYLVQVCANFKANDSIWINLAIDMPSPALYDTKATAADFGTLNGIGERTFDLGCLSIDDANETCPTLGNNYANYSQTAWVKFRTSPHADLLHIRISSTFFDTADNYKMGYILYTGDVSGSSLAALDTVVINMTSGFNQYWGEIRKQFVCDEFIADTNYFIQLFYHKNITASSNSISITCRGEDTSVAHNPSNIPATHRLGVIANGQTKTAKEYFNCRSSLFLNTCGSAAAGPLVIDTGFNHKDTFDLGTWLTFEITGDGYLDLGGTSMLCNTTEIALYNYYLFRLFSGDISQDCNLNLILQQKFMGERKICISPGKYSLQVLSKSVHSSQFSCAPSDLGNTIFTRIRFLADYPQTPSLFDQPSKAENIGTISNTPLSVKLSAIDYFGGTPDSVTIDSIKISGRILYRQFYLSKPSFIEITRNITPIPEASPQDRIFKGKARDGIDSLKRFRYRYVQNPTVPFYSNSCTPLDSGWYTIVTALPSSCFRNQNADYSHRIRIATQDTCRPQFNKPYRAFAFNNDNALDWGPNTGNASTPKYANTYASPTECFPCRKDSLLLHPVTSCDDSTRGVVSYYVFKLQRESRVSIFPGAYPIKVYRMDVRKDSLQMVDSTRLVEGCREHNFFCRMQPGTYSIAVFGNPGENVALSIMVDKVEVSAYDHAINSNDLGLIPPNNNRFNSQPDFISCTTGSDSSVPYPMPFNYAENSFETPRDLWYTFTATGTGRIQVTASTITPGINESLPFVIYKSAKNGATPWSILRTNGEVDSTYEQGLTYLTNNSYPNNNFAAFDKQGCDTARYYVVVSTRLNSYYYIRENFQVQVGVQYNGLVLPQAGDFCNNAVPVAANGPGTFKGSALVNCHTMGESYGEDGSNMGCLALNEAAKTSWFKFTLQTSQKVDLSFTINNLSTASFEQIKYRVLYGSCQAMTPGPCLENGLSSFKLDCMSPGDYYVQVVTPLTATGYIEAELNVTASVYPVCKPFSLITPLANFSNTGDCNRKTISFNNLSSAGPAITYLWDFDNGITSTAMLPTVTFTPLHDIDTFMVKLVVNDHEHFTSDSILIPVIVHRDPFTLDAGPDIHTIYGDATVQLQATTNYPNPLFNWQPEALVSNPYIAQPFVQSYITTTYKVQMQGEECVMTDSVTVFVHDGVLAGDELICGNDTAVLFAIGTFDTYLWSTGETQQSIKVTQPGTYKITVTKGSVTSQDSILVSSRNKPFLSLISDTFFCAGASVMIHAGNSYNTYKWSTGTHTPSITVSEKGTYSLMVSDGFCDATDSVTVYELNPKPALPPDTGFCKNTAIKLDAGPGFDSYVWSTGATTQSITVSVNGLYTVLVMQKSCAGYDSTTVDDYPSEKIFTRSDTTFCEAFQLILDAGEGSDYTWLPSQDQSRHLIVTDFGSYIVSKTDSLGCLVTDSFRITDYCRNGDVFVPNAFTVNSDGLNDVFKAYGRSNITSFTMQIYNRWGELVFSSDNINTGWDGTFKGSAAQADVYTWVVSYSKGGGVRQTQKGNLTLLR